MAPPPFIARNLTPIYRRHRDERRHAKGRLANGAEQTGQRLLACDADPRGGETVVEMTALPPQWVDSAEEAREDIKAIREKLVQLTKAQQKRLLKVFSDDAAPNKEVEAVSSQISGLVRRCEQQIHAVKTRGAGCGTTAKDADFRQNVQRSLATQLQQLSQQFRQSQNDYLAEIQKRQKGSLWDDGLDMSAIGGKKGPSDLGFNDCQLQELEGMELNASQRSSEICQIAASITDLHTIFKELAVLVIDQGSILDRIDYNIEQVVVQSQQANEQLQKAEASLKSNRAMKCIIALVVINLLLIIILIIKARH